jgi:hypothetical protein
VQLPPRARDAGGEIGRDALIGIDAAVVEAAVVDARPKDAPVLPDARLRPVDRPADLAASAPDAPPSAPD